MSKYTVGTKLVDARKSYLTAEITEQNGELFTVAESGGEKYTFIAEDLDFHYVLAEKKSNRFFVDTVQNGIEEVGAARANFGPAHVVFTDEAGELVVAYRASDVVTVVKEDEE